MSQKTNLIRPSAATNICPQNTRNITKLNFRVLSCISWAALKFLCVKIVKAGNIYKMIKDDILKYLHVLNEKLLQRNVKGEICLYGGAVMCLVYDARPSTKDVDAIFQPSGIIREAAKEIAIEYDLVNDWLNDGVKGFLVEHPRKVFLNLSHLVVMVADDEYMLAMKSLSARIDGTDGHDILFLIKELKITTVDDVFKIIDKYYPRRIIKPATQFFLEEIFGEIQDNSRN